MDELHAALAPADSDEGVVLFVLIAQTHAAGLLRVALVEHALAARIRLLFVRLLPHRRTSAQQQPRGVQRLVQGTQHGGVVARLAQGVFCWGRVHGYDRLHVRDRGGGQWDRLTL